MISDPVEIAFREVAETKRLLETLITSSESFDYHGAKAALIQLQRKVQVLGKLEAELSAQRGSAPECVIPFPATSARTN